MFRKYPVVQKQIKKLAYVIVIVLIFSVEIVAQTSNANPRMANISLISRADSDSVVLRWAPTKAGGWVIANKIGYVVERLVIDQDNPVDFTKYEQLTENPLKPLALDEWKAKTNKDNMFSAVAAQALYGKLFNPTPTGSGDLNALRNAADELTNRYSFSLFAADNDAFTADALGLRWVDKDIEKGKKYAYRVFVAQLTEEYEFDTAYILVNAIPYKASSAPKELRYESGDGSVKLHWKENDAYSGYYVYRSDDGGQSYKKLNDLPIVTITPANAYTQAEPSYLDTTTTNYIEYKYQVRGVTAFAELSDAAETKAISKDKKAPLAPRINKPEQISSNEMKISWEMENPPKDLQGFIVSKSIHSLHGYQLVTIDPLPKNTNEYIVNMGNEYELYYTVAAVDTAGNMTFSVPVLASRIIDSPPAIPTGLVGEVNDNGLVTLRWNRSPESNIKGYRVLMANDPKHNFTQITGQIHTDTVFENTVSLNTLTRNVYFRIAAVDNRYQHSEMSPILELERPDIIAPSEAVFNDVFVTDSSVQLKWYASTSNDLAMQVVLKRLKDEENWINLDTLESSVSSYTDIDIETATIYEYSILSIDQSGLSSKLAFPVMARPYDSGKRIPVQNLNAEYEQSNKTVTLTWSYSPLEKERSWFVIYKALNNGDFKEHKSVDAVSLSFIDNNVKPGNVSYGIVVMTSHGGESEMVTSSILIEETE